MCAKDRGANETFVPRFHFWTPAAMSVARGFTLPELIAVMVIVGILAAVATPKLVGGYHEAAFAEEVTAALRYAQRSAVTMQRTVCVTLGTTPSTVTLNYLTNYGDANCASDPSSGLVAPGGGAGAYVVDAQHGSTFASSASFTGLTVGGTSTAFPYVLSFNRAGSPSAAGNVVLTVNGGTTITTEAISGYVH